MDSFPNGHMIVEDKMAFMGNQLIKLAYSANKNQAGDED